MQHEIELAEGGETWFHFDGEGLAGVPDVDFDAGTGTILFRAPALPAGVDQRNFEGSVRLVSPGCDGEYRVSFIVAPAPDPPAPDPPCQGPAAEGTDGCTTVVPPPPARTHATVTTPPGPSPAASTGTQVGHDLVSPDASPTASPRAQQQEADAGTQAAPWLLAAGAVLVLALFVVVASVVRRRLP